MPARIFSIPAASPKPLMTTLQPEAASARAMPSPMPEVGAGDDGGAGHAGGSSG